MLCAVEGDPERFSDLRVGHASGDEAGHLTLTVGDAGSTLRRACGHPLLPDAGSRGVEALSLPDGATVALFR